MNRREFLKSSGVMVGCLAGGVRSVRDLVPIAGGPPSPAASTLFLRPCHTGRIGVKASFTGVGTVGNHAAQGLRQVFGQANARRRFQGLHNSTFAVCSAERGKALPPGTSDEQHMAFLLGSTGDPLFWHERKTILSSSPHFLLTLGVGAKQGGTAAM